MPIAPAAELRAKLESILFAAGKPLLLKKLAELTGAAQTEVEQALGELQQAYQAHSHGLELIRHQGEVVLATHPQYSELVREFLKKEEYGELTQPQLEALSVLAYRGALSKAELEQVRGVNCSLILRNLMIRGLVQVVDEAAVVPRYQVTLDFFAHLGLRSAEELPGFAELSQHPNVQAVLEQPEPQV